MKKKGFAYIGTAVVSILLVMALVLSGCQRKCPGCVTLQSLSHMSGPLDITGAGTAAAPALILAGDSNTGIYQSAADNWDISVAGSNILNVSAAGPAWSGSAFDVDVTGAASIDADLASNFNASVGDLTLEAETGSVVIKGDEAVADAIYLDANDAVTTGITSIVGTAGTFGVTGYIADFDMTGGISLDADLASNFSAAAGDITVDAETGSVNIIGSEANAAAIYFDANDTATSGVDIDTGTTSGLTIDGGPFSVDGTGAFNVNTAAGDITVEAETGSVVIKGDEEVADAILLNAATTVTQGIDINVGSVYGMSVDGGLTDFGTGTYATADGDNDVGIEGDLEVNGAVDHDGTTFDSDVSAAISLDAGATSNLNTSAGDINLEAETGSVWIKGDEEVADAIHLDANATVTQGIDIDLGSVYGMSIDGGLTDFGAGTYTVADGDEDVGIDGVLEVNDVAYLDGGAEVNGTLTLENDETIVNSENGVITATVAAGGWFAITTGNLVVGTPGTASLTLNGNDAYVEGTLESDGLARLDGGATVVGDLTISNGLTLPGFADETITDGEWLTPTVSVYGLDSGGNVTMTLGAGCTDGQMLTLIGDDANNIVINDTNVRTSTGGALTIGQYDVVGWICMDSEWLELYIIANS